jgi:phthalate 4,5-cis-dihydrodiol dehydrogenase
MTQLANQKLRLGVAGLGRAFSIMLPTFAADPRITLVAGADPRAEARSRLAADFAAKTFDSVEALCADPGVEVIYIATPHQHHVSHARLAAEHGKHILLEKPIALKLEEAVEVIEAARRARVQLIVGHSHSYDAPILRTRALISSGEFGRVRMMTALNYTGFIYRPRRPEELDTALGGGALFSQAPHQVDVVRLLGGGDVRSVRAMTGAWDRARPTEGAYAALLTFADGSFASLSYSGYGNFDSDELQGWVGEMGEAKQPQSANAPLRFVDLAEETAFKRARTYGGADWKPSSAQALAHQHFGPVIVSCEHADLRPLPNGVMIYQHGAARLDSLPAPIVPRVEVIDELYDAIVHGRRPLHDGAWAMATLEVCLAMLRSAREGVEIMLSHQVGVK